MNNLDIAIIVTPRTLTDASVAWDVQIGEAGPLFAATSEDDAIEMADEIKAAMVDLKSKHADAMQQHEARGERLKAYMAETVPLDLSAVSFCDLPRKISGDWMLAIAEMIEGLPTEEGGE